MSAKFTQRTLLALLAALACVGIWAVAALAGTGGVGVPGSPSANIGPTKARVHRSGIATWFGPGFYGKQTACGQVLTPETVGVANRTLPCGTLVKVSYRGHLVTLPVIDRGPYGTGADWDLTTGAARTLGVEDTVRIGTRIIGTAPNTPTLGLPPGSPTSVATGGAIAG
jgi:rare lipoprotein A (peptidoglycan hydrolase)